ncbi:MAG: hypothetical protein LGB01_03445 [Sulfurovum sp.]|nr:hypothetical protein [Sulfurovum sp.]
MMQPLAGTNIGAEFITCNYDGKSIKLSLVKCFVGSDTQLIARYMKIML